MKKLLAVMMAGLGIGAALFVPQAKAADLCKKPPGCVFVGEVAGTTIFDGDIWKAVQPYTAIYISNQLPRVSVGFFNIDVTFQPTKLVAPPSQVQVRTLKGSGTVVVTDDDLLSPDRTWKVDAFRSGTPTEGTISLRAAGVDPNLFATGASAFSLNVGYRTANAVTTIAGSFEEAYDGNAPYESTPIEEVLVNSADFDGTTTTSVLDAGATYKLTATGTYDYDNQTAGQQLADAECSIDTQNPSTIESLSTEVPRWQPQRYFFFGRPQDAPLRDFFDPDPTDDYTDLYVDGRDLIWVPNDPDVVNRMGCNEVDHTYVALFTPATDRPLELRIFDTQYSDNGCSTTGCTTSSLKVSIAKVSNSPAPGADGVRFDSALVNTGDVDGQATRPLASDRTYVVEVRGQYKYQDTFPKAFYADAECARAGNTGAADNSVYHPHRFDGVSGFTDPLDIYLDGNAVDWEPLGRTPSQIASADTAQCSPIHAYRTTVVGTGAPLQILLKDFATKYGDNAGTLRVDLVELS